jgi:hypothetical protein
MSAAKKAPEKKKTIRDFHEEVQLGKAYDAGMLRRGWAVNAAPPGGTDKWTTHLGRVGGGNKPRPRHKCK